jgi:hypothetical protein
MVFTNRSMLLIVKHCAAFNIKEKLRIYSRLNFGAFASFCFIIYKAIKLTKKCIGHKIVLNNNNNAVIREMKQSRIAV